MVLDECTKFPATEDQARTSMELSLRWAARSKDAFIPRPGYALFGIVQGGVHPDLRAASAAGLTGIGFDGYAIGGLAVGEGQAAMFAVLDVTAPLLPADRAALSDGGGHAGRHPGRGRARGRHVRLRDPDPRGPHRARLHLAPGVWNLRNARFAADPAPLDPGCACPACARHSRAYLHHLFRAKEMLGPMLLTWHNLTYYQDLMRGLRDAIAAGGFAAHAARLRAGWAGEEVP